MAALVVASGQRIDSFVSSIALAAVIQFGVITGIFVAADREITTDLRSAEGQAAAM